MGGIELLLTEIFRLGNGDRPSVPNVVISIIATNADRRLDEMSPIILAARDAGIKSLLIRITEHEPLSTGEANRLRAINVHLYLINRIQDLGTVVNEVVDESCSAEGNVK